MMSAHARPMLLPLLALALGTLALADALGPRATYRLDLAFGDWLVARQAPRHATDDGVQLVTIDERSLALLSEEFGRWPWPRSAHAELATGLRAAGASAVVFDVLMTDPDPNAPDADQWFLETVQGDDRIYLPMVRLDPAADAAGLDLDAHGAALGFERGPWAAPGARAALALPFAAAAETTRIGTINFLADVDGVGRRYWTNLDVQGWRIPSLPARVARDLAWSMPDVDTFEIAWHSASVGAPRRSFVDVLTLLREAPAKATEEFAGRVIVVGSDAASLGDVRPTPLSTATPGVDVLVAALATLRNGDAPVRPGALISASVTLVLLAGLALAAAQGVGPAALALACLALASLALPVAWISLGRGLYLPAASPVAWAAALILIHVAVSWAQERRARQHIERTFGRFVDPRVVADLVRSGGTPTLRGELREVTVLFSDIRGFTSLSETRSPEEIVDLLNRYFTRQVEVVFRHGGTVDKFIGDCIMAFWGAPVDDPKHAQHAVAAALEMARVAAEFRDGLPGARFEVGIGLNSGPATVGLMGAPSKLDYTVIGDTVNLASRIEGATKDVATILVSDATRQACGSAFAFREHGRVKVKGRDADVGLHEPLGGSGT